MLESSINCNYLKTTLISSYFPYKNLKLNHVIWYCCLFRSTIHYTEAMELLKNIDPPLGFGKKCPDKMAYKRLIRMNMPIDKEGRVTFTTTLFALIRDNLKINVRESAEMDQADLELRATIMKVWPVTRAGKIDMLVPTEECKFSNSCLTKIIIVFVYL